MRIRDIRRHLGPYLIAVKRRTTIDHAFAAAIALYDLYDEDKVRKAVIDLGQNPDDLLCVYCGAGAETWDHVHGTVRGGVFSGHGHRLGNLLPCCKNCNSKKGNRNWHDYLAGVPVPDETVRTERERRIAAYLKKYGGIDVIPQDLPEYEELQKLRLQVHAIFLEADKLAAVIRQKSIEKPEEHSS